jgi:hypothetical protein
MAEDTAELLRQLKIERADFFGYSVLQKHTDKEFKMN